jgi:hypothetical protein
MPQAKSLIAGSVVKATTQKMFPAIDAKIFLLIEGVSLERMLEVKQSLLDDPKILWELAKTLYPWPGELFSMEYANLMEHLTVADVWTQGGEDDDNN